MTGAEARASLAGRRGPSRASPRSGRYIRSAPLRPDERSFPVAVDATLRRAALRQAREARQVEQPFAVIPEDLCKKVRKRPRKTVIIFVVDASDSMGTETRMGVAKGAVLALLTRAYQRRDRVGVVTFREEKAEVLLRPTTSVNLARESLCRLPTGGATPFADGLWKAWQLLRMERVKEPGIEPVLVVISDGEANVPLEPGREPRAELHALARAIRDERIRAVAIDTTSPFARTQEMIELARSLGARYHRAQRLQASTVVAAVQAVESQ